MSFPHFCIRKPRFRQWCMLHSQFKTRSLIPLSTPLQTCSVRRYWLDCSLVASCQTLTLSHRATCPCPPWASPPSRGPVPLICPLLDSSCCPKDISSLAVEPAWELSPRPEAPSSVLPCPSKTFLSPRCLDFLVRVPVSWSPLVTFLHSICAGHSRLDSWMSR